MHNPIASRLLKTTAAKRLEKRRYSASMIWDVILHRSALSSERQFGPLIWFIKSLVLSIDGSAMEAAVCVAG